MIANKLQKIKTQKLNNYKKISKNGNKMYIILII